MARRKRIARQFLSTGAVSPESARTPEALGVSCGLVFRRMVKGGVLKPGAGGTFWIDEAEYEASRRRAARNVLIAFALVAVAFTVLYFTR